MNFKKQIEKMETQRRNRAIIRCRLRCGLQTLWVQPWTLIFPLLLVAFTALVCYNLDKLPLPGGNSDIPGLLALWEIAVALLIVTFAVLLVTGVLVLLGTPHKAKLIDAGLVHIALVDRYGLGPALISVQQVGREVKRLTFYSKGIGKERWAQKQAAIEDVLSYCLAGTDPIEYGKNRNYIVLTVSSVKGTRDEPLYDDEF